MTDLVGLLPTDPTRPPLRRPLDAITRIAMHHTAGPATQTPYEIARFHVEARGWRHIGYHYLVSADGTVYKCLTADTIPICVAKANTPTLCVCLIGTFTDRPVPLVQWRAAVSLVRDLRMAYGIGTVLGHREIPGQATSCPGFDMDRFRADVEAV